MSEFERYEVMRERGATPAEVYIAAKAVGEDDVTCIRLLRAVFNLSIVEAKEVTVGASLHEHQSGLAPALEEALRDDPDQDDSDRG
jgi:ribosomal protein L7/L12